MRANRGTLLSSDGNIRRAATTQLEVNDLASRLCQYFCFSGRVMQRKLLIGPGFFGLIEYDQSARVTIIGSKSSREIFG